MAEKRHEGARSSLGRAVDPHPQGRAPSDGLRPTTRRCAIAWMPVIAAARLDGDPIDCLRGKMALCEVRQGAQGDLRLPQHGARDRGEHGGVRMACCYALRVVRTCFTSPKGCACSQRGAPAAAPLQWRRAHHHHQQGLLPQLLPPAGDGSSSPRTFWLAPAVRRSTNSALARCCSVGNLSSAALHVPDPWGRSLSLARPFAMGSELTPTVSLRTCRARCCRRHLSHAGGAPL